MSEGVTVQTGLDQAIKYRLKNGNKKRSVAETRFVCVSVCLCDRVMCFVSLEAWGRMYSLPQSSQTSAAVSILRKIIQKKGWCNSLGPGDWTGSRGQPGQLSSES